MSSIHKVLNIDELKNILNPTLFNASKGSSLIYKITPDLTTEKIIELNLLKTYTERFNWLKTNGYQLSFERIVSDIFTTNLELIDCCMPEIISEIVLCKTFNGINKLSAISAFLTENNPCNFNVRLNPNFYEYKIKRLLVDVALGMKAASLWTGNFNITGGYIVVKQNGDLVCYHIYNWNDFQNYLMNHTRIEHPDSSENRTDFGKILTEKEINADLQKINRNDLQFFTKGTYIKINFQIRFLK
jgi:type II restriction enzyme